MASTSLPTRQTAIVTTPDGGLSASASQGLPPLTPTTILVRTHAVALAHSDYKMPARQRAGGLRAGADFAGVVVHLGSSADACLPPGRRPWAVGDRVCGAVHGADAARPLSGGHAEYVDADGLVLMRVPDGWSWEEAVALGGCNLSGVGLALYRELGVELPGVAGDEGAIRGLDLDGGEGFEKRKAALLGGTLGLEGLKKVVLVYGGSSACGTLAMQLLRLAGYTPIATCSPRSDALVASYGAAAAFDYADPEACASRIKALTRNSLRLAVDCIGAAQSLRVCHSAMGRTGGRYVSLERLPGAGGEPAGARKVVKSSWVMGTDVYGRAVGLRGYERDADPAARELAGRMFWLVERLVWMGLVRPHPVQVLGGTGRWRWEGEVGKKERNGETGGGDGEGWAGAVLEGLEMLKGGKVSGVRLVVKVVD